MYIKKEKVKRDVGCLEAKLEKLDGVKSVESKYLSRLSSTIFNVLIGIASGVVCGYKLDSLYLMILIPIAITALYVWFVIFVFKVRGFAYTNGTLYTIDCVLTDQDSNAMKKYLNTICVDWSWCVYIETPGGIDQVTIFVPTGGYKGELR